MVHRLIGLNPPVKYFTDRSKAVLLLCIIYVISVLFYYAFMHVCLLMPVVTCWERADLLALLCDGFCDIVTFPLVSWVRCAA